jgi:hypothetical protein
MSAVGQGTGGGEAAQGQGEAQDQGQAAPDLNAFTDQLSQIAQGQEEMRQYLASNPWQAAEQPDDGQQQQPQELDLSWLDSADPAYDPQAVGQRLNDVISQAAQTQAQQIVGPMQEQLLELRRDQQARDLAAEFPEIAQPDVAQKIAGPGGLAHQYAEMLGQPGLAAEPSFWRLCYMANKAADAANAEQEGSEGPGAAHLESGAGAGPAGQQVDLKALILGADGPRGSKVLDFKT